MKKNYVINNLSKFFKQYEQKIYLYVIVYLTKVLRQYLVISLMIIYLDLFD